MSDFELKRSKQRHSAVQSGSRAPLQHFASARSPGNFQSFPQKRLAMQQLLRAIANQRASEGEYRNPWAEWSEDKLETYTDQVIDRLQKIRMQDLQVAQAIYLEGDASNKPPQDRRLDLEAALEATRKRGDELQGSTKASNKNYQKQLERDLQIQQRLYENRAELKGDENVDESNINTLLLESQEKPGYVRVYMTVFAPSSDETRKDLQKDGGGRIVGRSDMVWLNFGSPARALSYVNAYRLQMGPGATPLIRSMLVPMRFLEEHFPGVITETKAEKDAIDRWARTDSSWQINRRQQKVNVVQRRPFMNTDTKFPNQMGLEAFTKRLVISKPGVARRADQQNVLTDTLPWWEQKMTPEKLQIEAAESMAPSGAERGDAFKILTTTVNPVYNALLNAADPGSFTTYANPDRFGARHDESVDGKRGDFDSLASSIGLASTGDPFTAHLLRGGERPATLFSLYDNGKWKSPSTAQLGAIINDANALFDGLDSLPDDGALGQHVGGDIGADLRAPLGDLLEANRLTPRDLSFAQGGATGARRDVYGNSALKMAFERAFADEYLKSNVWRSDMAKWSGSLATFISQQRNANALYDDAYVRDDMQALRGDVHGARPSTPLEELKKMSGQGPTSPPVHDRQVDLFFHLLRALGKIKPELKRDSLGRKLFGVNNRTVATPFDIINPRPGLRNGRPDASVNRFKPDHSKKETKLMRDLDVPFLGGVSGTTRDYNNMMHAVFGVVSPEEFWRFQLLNASFMIKHGYHSMFEVLYPATFYERTRGDPIQEEYGALKRRETPSSAFGFYMPALTAALGSKGKKLWKTARKRAKKALSSNGA